MRYANRAFAVVPPWFKTATLRHCRTSRQWCPIFVVFLLVAGLFVGPTFAAGRKAVVGEVEETYTLPGENTQASGVAVDDAAQGQPVVYVLDHSGRLFAYNLPGGSRRRNETLKPLAFVALPKQTDGSRLRGPHGLAVDTRENRRLFYFLNWEKGSKGPVRSQLWRWDPRGGAESADLTAGDLPLGTRRTLSVALDGDDVLIAYDAAGVKGLNARVQRGLVRLRWPRTPGVKPVFVRHMPDAGAGPSRGLARMTLDGANYLWATVGNGAIYCAEASTGRGLFFFDRPVALNASGVALRGTTCEGLAFGAESLWVVERSQDADFLHRVNVTKNLDAPLTGPRILRRLTMSIHTAPEKGQSNPGKAYHFYSRPYGFDELPRQGVWPETETVVDLSKAKHAAVKPFTHDPAGDRSARQYMQSVVYADPSPKSYASQYEIDYWTSEYKTFVYPHRVNNQSSALRSTRYLADDPMLYNLTDRETYAKFVERVKSHVEKKYGAPADMKNAYWAARNVVEYIQDHYYYPSPEKGFYATTDWKHGHFDANPGNLKLALSAKPYDKTQIIACSGTSVAVAGAMRHLGVPARWLGTAMERGSADWDKNFDWMLDRNESATLTNGHRYSQVWLGGHYGWTCFDATPVGPPGGKFDSPPPWQSQWQYMSRCAAGHRSPMRVVFNIGSEAFQPLCTVFEYREGAPVNHCGGNQRYNLMGRFDHPERWKPAGLRISARNVCFITDVKVSGRKDRTRLTWKLDGKWRQTPESKLSVFLAVIDMEAQKRAQEKAKEKVDRQEEEEREDDVRRDGEQVCKVVEELVHGIPIRQASITLDLSKHRGKNLCLLIRKVGDPETGGHSGVFDLE